MSHASDALLLDRRARSGHNLLEVILACFLFSTVVIMFLGVWASFYRAQAQSRNRLAATSLGRAVLEQKVAAGFAANDPAAPDPGPVTVIAESELKGRPATCKLVYEFHAVDTKPEFRQLLVTVKWSDSTGDHTLSYETYIYRTT